MQIKRRKEEEEEKYDQPKTTGHNELHIRLCMRGMLIPPGHGPWRVENGRKNFRQLDIELEIVGHAIKFMTERWEAADDREKRRDLSLSPGDSRAVAECTREMRLRGDAAVRVRRCQSDLRASPETEKESRRWGRHSI